MSVTATAVAQELDHVGSCLGVKEFTAAAPYPATEHGRNRARIIWRRPRIPPSRSSADRVGSAFALLTQCPVRRASTLGTTLPHRRTGPLHSEACTLRRSARRRHGEVCAIQGASTAGFALDRVPAGVRSSAATVVKCCCGLLPRRTRHYRPQVRPAGQGPSPAPS